MFIRKLKPGERANETADKIRIDRNGDGRISWTASVKVGGKAEVGGSLTDFATVQEAETDAIAWARDRGAQELQIEGPNA